MSYDVGPVAQGKAILSLMSKDISIFTDGYNLVKGSVDESFTPLTAEYANALDDSCAELFECLKKTAAAKSTKDSFDTEVIEYIYNCIDSTGIEDGYKEYHKTILGYFFSDDVRDARVGAIKVYDLTTCPTKYRSTMISLKLAIANDELNFDEIARLIDLTEEK